MGMPPPEGPNYRPPAPGDPLGIWTGSPMVPPDQVQWTYDHTPQPDSPGPGVLPDMRQARLLARDPVSPEQCVECEVRDARQDRRPADTRGRHGLCDACRKGLRPDVRLSGLCASCVRDALPGSTQCSVCDRRPRALARLLLGVEGREEPPLPGLGDGPCQRTAPELQRLSDWAFVTEHGAAPPFTHQRAVAREDEHVAGLRRRHPHGRHGL